MTATDHDEDVPMQASENRHVFGYLTSRPWIPLVLGFAMVLAVGVITTLTVAASQTYNREVRHALVTLGAADSVALSILEMNSAQRGYILNRDEAFRKRYIQARSHLDRDMRALRREYAILDLPEGLEEEVEVAVNDRISAFNDINRMLIADDVAGAGRYSAEARLFTDGVRDALRKVKQVAYGRLYESQRAATTAGDRAYLLIIAGLIMACMLILGSIVLLMRRSSELEQANADVRQLAETLEHRVEERTADLAEANEEIQRFAYIVSHDLRSPLVNIMGFTAELEDAQRTMADYATAEDSAVPPDVREAIVTDMPEAMGFIRAATGRMDRLIKAILQISREGRRTLTRDTIDLRALFEGIADSLSGQTDAAGATITVGDLPEVEGDRTALEQVFGNLLDNAVKYLRPGVPGEIKVTGEQRGKRVVIRVEDNGRGIAAHDRRRVFELFRRSGEQDRPGEGIGLAHVQALVRRLGGQIHVESELGEGSCFTVTLPLTMATRN